MLDMELQRRIRERKTPLALTLAPDPARLSEKILKNFTDMFGDTPMAQAEALRYTVPRCWTRRRAGCPP